MRHVSRVVAPVIAALGALTMLTVLYVAFEQARVFPDHVARYMWKITAHSRGTSESEAIANLLAPRQRAGAFLRANGFSAGAITIGAPGAYDSGIDSSEPRWSGYQDIGVPADTYARFARLSNRLTLYQDHRDDLTWSFPEPPFAPFAKIVGALTIFLLCLSAVSLETRTADVTRAPRGMHPFVVAIQTIVAGLLILVAIVQAHVLALYGPRVLALILVIGLISLGAWLYKTAAWWKDSRFLRLAYPFYVAAFAAVVLFGAWAMTIPVI